MPNTAFDPVVAVAAAPLPRLGTNTRVKPARVAALSATFAIHLAGFSLLLMPLTQPIEDVPRVVDIPISWIEAPKPIEAPPVPIKRVVSVAKPKPTPVRSVPVPPIVFERAVMSGPATETPTIDLPFVDSAEIAEVTNTGPVEAGPLGIISGPHPRYPTVAIRKRMEGEVMLRILVDTSGRPIDIAIERSSGHPTLDKAARDAVKKWKFKPAMRNGMPVQAYGTVPVVFSLSQG